MAIKKADELFGDDGVNGPRAPIDHNSWPAYGPNNRAIGFGESLTSMSSNRTTYALALNDEDLDTRISVFEVGGLDAAYRLGALDDPGGGRVIEADGGAMEVRTAHANLFDSDSANAAVRARLDADTSTGGIGFDAVSRGGTGADATPGASAFGFLDRRALAFDTIYTKLALTESGVLNPGSAGATILELDPASDGFFEGPEGTDLLAGVDFIEILDSAFAGLYPITDVEGRRAVLGQLDRDVPHFAPNTPVTFRLFRATFAAGSVEGYGGASLAALPAAGVTEVLRLAHSTDDVGRFLVARGRHGNVMVNLDTAGNLTLNGGVTASRLDAAQIVGTKAVITQVDTQRLGPTNISSTLLVYPKTTFKDEVTFEDPALFEQNVTVVGQLAAGSLSLSSAFEVNAPTHVESITVDNDTIVNNITSSGTFRSNGPFLLGPGREVQYADAGGTPTYRQRVTIHPIAGAGFPGQEGTFYGSSLGILLRCGSQASYIAPSYQCGISLPLGAVLKRWRVLARIDTIGGAIRGGAKLMRLRPNFNPPTPNYTQEDVEPIVSMVTGDFLQPEVLSSNELNEVIDGTFALSLGLYVTTKVANQQVILGIGGIELTWLDYGPRSG